MTEERWPWWIGLAGVAAVFLLPAGLLWAIDRVANRPNGTGTLIIEAINIAVALLLARRFGPLRRATFGWRPMSITPAGALLWILLAFVAVGAANAAYASVVPHWYVTRIYRYQNSELESWLLVIAAVVAAPVAEELFFRGFLYRALRNSWGVALAVLVSSAIFGMAHWWFGDPIQSVFPRVTIGIALALLYEHTGSLYPGMLAHAWINLGLAGRLEPALRTVAGLGILITIVVLLVRSRKDPRRRKFRKQAREPSTA